MAEPRRGEIWDVDLRTTIGHEQAGRRPALVISHDGFNEGLAGLVIVIAITTKAKGIPLHVEVKPPEAGLTQRSFIMCDQVRTIAKERLSPQRTGVVSRFTLSAVEDRLRILLDL